MSAIEDRRSATVAADESIRQGSEAFGSQLNWISAEARSDGSIELAINEYDEFKISAPLTRAEALALRDFITATYES